MGRVSISKGGSYPSTLPSERRIRCTQDSVCDPEKVGDGTLSRLCVCPGKGIEVRYSISPVVDTDLI